MSPVCLAELKNSIASKKVLALIPNFERELPQLPCGEAKAVLVELVRGLNTFT